MTEGGCPHLETHAAYTQLLTYSNAFGNSYWTKSGATIEGDASTAGESSGVRRVRTMYNKDPITVTSGATSYTFNICKSSREKVALYIYCGVLEGRYFDLTTWCAWWHKN
jgi:hypothetical protein